MARKPDDTPLLGLAHQNQTERLALVRSIRRDATGLGPRAFTRLITLLERLAADSFSDGVETVVRVRKLADVLNCNRSTVFRSLADARRLGIVKTESRFGQVDQQVSSRRVINWSVVRLLCDRATAPPLTATPPSQLRPPRRNCDAPVATATPNNPDSPDKPDRKQWSGIPDRKFASDRKRITADEIADRVATVFDRMNYHGAEGWIYWLAIAAIDSGILAPADVGRTLEACKAAGGSKGPGYFRTVLADKAGQTPAELTRQLKTLAIVWGDHSPGQRPKPHTAAATLRRVPTADASTDTQRREVNRQLEQLLQQ